MRLLGQWEGDLFITELNQSRIGTLVERTTVFLVLCKMENKSASAGANSTRSTREALH